MRKRNGPIQQSTATGYFFCANQEEYGVTASLYSAIQLAIIGNGDANDIVGELETSSLSLQPATPTAAGRFTIYRYVHIAVVVGYHLYIRDVPASTLCNRQRSSQKAVSDDIDNMNRYADH